MNMNYPHTQIKTVLRTVVAVLWAFFGIRKSSEYDKDVNLINPIHAIIVGVIMAIIFVSSLLMLVFSIT